MNKSISQNQLALRIQQARKESGLTQEEVTQSLGFKDRQILSNIESGLRKISADELVKFMKVLNKNLDYFTDPYLLTDPNVFSWRANHQSRELDDFENWARQLVMAYRRFSDLLGETASPVLPRLTLTPQSSYEDASQCAERFVLHYRLGEVPADKLLNVLEQKLELVVLFVQAPKGVSGAACHFPDLNIILINLLEPSGRRNYNLAHEVFHLLTWETMPPEKLDTSDEWEKGKSRVEKLAENFAASLLMPEKAVRVFWDKLPNEDIHDCIVKAARHFHVSGPAIKHRLKNLELITKDDSRSIDNNSLKHAWKEDVSPKLYSQTFVDKLHGVLTQGLVSVRKASELLRMSLEEIADLFKSYDKQVPFDL